MIGRIKRNFGYALKGRDGKSGLIAELSGKVLGRNCFRVPSDAYHKVVEFLSYWGVEHEKEQAWYVDNKQKT